MDQEVKDEGEGAKHRLKVALQVDVFDIHVALRAMGGAGGGWECICAFVLSSFNTLS